MTSKSVILGPARPTHGASQKQPFAIGQEENEAVARDSHIVNPKILILAVVAVVFFLFSLVWDSSPPQMTPLQKQLKDARVMESQMNYLKDVEKINGTQLQQTMSNIERQVLIVSRAEVSGDKAHARHEIRELMYIDGGHASSPLYRFCVSKIKEYE